MTKKSVKDARDEFKAKVANKKAAIQGLDPDVLKEHMERVRGVYHSSHKADKLGSFEWDSTYKYHWNTYDDGEYSDKLVRRLELGWGFATREDAKKSGLADEKINSSTIDGETCIEMSHKNCRAVLLKIHKDLFNLNTKVREDVEKERNQRDYMGSDVNTREVHSGHSTTVYHTEHTDSFE